jgi:hypothetical protein
MNSSDQGLIFTSFRKKYKTLLSKKNFINIGVIEGFEEMKIEDANAMEMQKIKKYTDRFNTNLATYTRTYKLYLDELIGRQKGGGTYSNKVITYKGDQYFVDKQGKIRKFSQTSWSSKGKGCGQPFATLNAEAFSKLQAKGIGPAMNPNERCKTGGYNVNDGSTYAWVDSNGYKHIYEDPNNKHSTCSDIPFIQGYSATEINAIPDSGSTQAADTECDKGTLDSPLVDQLRDINKKLMDDADAVKVLINNMRINDKTIETSVDAKRNKLMKVAKQLHEKRKVVLKAERDSHTLRSDLEDRVLEIGSMNFKKIIWVMAGITFVLVASKKITDATNK